MKNTIDRAAKCTHSDKRHQSGDYERDEEKCEEHGRTSKVIVVGQKSANQRIYESTAEFVTTLGGGAGFVYSSIRLFVYSSFNHYNLIHFDFWHGK